MSRPSCRPAALVVGLALLTAGLTTSLTAQPVRLQLPTTPVQPGVPFTVTVLGSFTSTDGPQLFLLRPTGELIAPFVWGWGPAGGAAGPITHFLFTAPATGDGSAGSFVLWFPAGSNSAVARLDVGTASVIATTHLFPMWVASSHATDMFCLTNTGAAQQVLRSGRIDLFAPGGTVSLAGIDLTGYVIDAGGVRFIPLPLAGLPREPMVVRATWVDSAGISRNATHGVQAQVYPPVEPDLQLPGGRDIARGGAIPVRIVCTPSASAAARFYAIVLGAAPGTTLLPSGQHLPVAIGDPFVLASLSNGLGIIDNGVGTTRSESVRWGHSVRTVHIAEGRIRHPNIPGVLGLRLRAAGFVLADFGVYGRNAWMASQSEDLTLR